jgi:T5SS/PEP-CTERM-associated repeat protein
MFNHLSSTRANHITAALACAMACLTSVAFTPTSDAAITSTGSIFPDYNGTDDPWIISNYFGSIGANAAGSLSITDGSVVSISPELAIGYYNGDEDAHVTVSGQGSTLNVAEQLIIGREGTGRLTIEDGGVVNVNDEDTKVGVYSEYSTSIHFNQGTLNTIGLTASPNDLHGVGTINAAGLFSDVDLTFNAGTGLTTTVLLNDLPGQNITVHVDAARAIGKDLLIGAGLEGQGSLTVSDGLDLRSTYGTLGYFEQAHGLATFNGQGTTWSIGSTLNVGNFGTGELNIQDGAVVTDWVGKVGAYLPTTKVSTVNVIGEGSEWIHTREMILGRGGRAVLNILDGGSVTTQWARINYENPDDTDASVVTVAGEGSTWTLDGYLRVGEKGNGVLNINHGGTVSLNGQLDVGNFPRNYGVVNLAGGTLDLNGNDISHGNSTSRFNFTGGVLKDVGTIDLSATIKQEGGVLAPGDPIGTTNVYPYYELLAGTVQIHMGGADNTHDRVTSLSISISPTNTTLELLPVGPVSAGTYEVLWVSSSHILTGEFEHITGLALSPGLVDVTYTDKSVLVTFNRDYLPGDLNGDGFVGIEDLNTVLSMWNQYLTPYDLSSGDVSGDGYVGIEDLNVVLGNWNTGTPPAIESLDLVPEPATIGLLAAGVLWGCGRRRGRRAVGAVPATA